MSAACALALVAVSGCTSTTSTGCECGEVEITPRRDISFDGIIRGYGTLSALNDHHEDTLHIGLANSARERGELFSLELAPLASLEQSCGWNGSWIGVGAGVLGVRAQVGPLELALGTFFFDPQPPRPGRSTWCDRRGADANADANGCDKCGTRSKCSKCKARKKHRHRNQQTSATTTGTPGK